MRKELNQHIKRRIEQLKELDATVPKFTTGTIVPGTNRPATGRIPFKFKQRIENFTKDIREINIGLHALFANDHEHSHEFFEVMYVYKGTCTQKINDRELSLHAGDVCMLNMQSNHIVHLDSYDSILINYTIDPRLFDKTFMSVLSGNDLLSKFIVDSIYNLKQKQHYLLFPSDASAYLGRLLSQMAYEYFEAKPYFQNALESMLGLVFTEMARIHIDHIDQEYDTGDHKLSQIVGYISDNYRDITLSDVADRFHYSSTYLSSMIKKNTGKSFSDFLNEYRITQASTLLKESELNIATISEMTGYYDQSYFNRIFKKTFSMTPAEYRKLHKV